MTYAIKNVSSDSIQVICTHVHGSLPIPDTFKIGYNQVITIAKIDKGAQHISEYKETLPSLSDFKQIDVYKISSGAASARSILNTSFWTYSENGALMATYNAVVTDANFR